MTQEEKDSMENHVNGLTKREQFAAMAMQGLLSVVNDPFNDFSVSEWAVKYADALLAELAKENEG